MIPNPFIFIRLPFKRINIHIIVLCYFHVQPPEFEFQYHTDNTV